MYSIGQMAQKTGVKVETIRYYERIGLMASPPRTHGGHRQYQINQLKQLMFIRRCRRLNFPIATIRSFLEFVNHGGRCGDIKLATKQHLDQIREKINSLQQLEQILAGLSADCLADTQSDCPLIDNLYEK